MGAILGPFHSYLGKNEFSWKKELCQFLDIPIIYHRVKNQKKLLRNFWGKHQTYRQTDRPWFYKTLCRKIYEKHVKINHATTHAVTSCKSCCTILIEYSTQVSEVFENCITFQSFSLQIRSKTKFKTSKNFEGMIDLTELQNPIQDWIPATRYKVSRYLVGRGLCYPYLGDMGDT